MLLPLFLNLAGRRVVLVGGGPVAAGKLQQLLQELTGVAYAAFHDGLRTVLYLSAGLALAAALLALITLRSQPVDTGS